MGTGNEYELDYNIGIDTDEHVFARNIYSGQFLHESRP